jgi:gag-polypeptide of LTR copia-type
MSELHSASLVFAVEDNQLVYLKKCKRGSECWKSLKEHHQQATLGMKIRVMKKLFRKQLEQGGLMRDHISEIFELLDLSSEMDNPIPDSIAVSMILSSLPEEYRITIQTVKAKLIEEWEKRSAGAVGHDLNAFKVVCYRCNQEGHKQYQCQQGRFMPNRNEADLRKKLQNRNVYENRKFNKDETPSAKVARFGEGNHSCEWIVDSGATRHMCSEKSNFRRIDETFSGNVKVADGQTIRAKGVGDVELIIFTEGEVFSVTLSNVLWVPELNENLISVNQLVAKDLL